MPGRHATFSISMEASPLVLYPRKKTLEIGKSWGIRVVMYLSG